MSLDKFLAKPLKNIRKVVFEISHSKLLMMPPKPMFR